MCCVVVDVEFVDVRKCVDGDVDVSVNVFV